MGKRFFLGTKRSGRDVDLSPPSIVVVSKYSSTSTRPTGLHSVGRDIFTFTSIYYNSFNSFNLHLFIKKARDPVPLLFNNLHAHVRNALSWADCTCSSVYL